MKCSTKASNPQFHSAIAEYLAPRREYFNSSLKSLLIKEDKNCFYAENEIVRLCTPLEWGILEGK